MSDTNKPVYVIENIVRQQGSRLHRAKSPTRHRFSQFIGGRKVIRNKNLTLTVDQFKKNEKAINNGVMNGTLAVIMPDKTRVTSLVDGRLFVDVPGKTNKILDKGAAFPWATEEKKTIPTPAPVKVESPVVDTTYVKETTVGSFDTEPVAVPFVQEEPESEKKYSYKKRSKK